MGLVNRFLLMGVGALLLSSCAAGPELRGPALSSAPSSELADGKPAVTLSSEEEPGSPGDPLAKFYPEAVAKARLLRTQVRCLSFARRADKLETRVNYLRIYIGLILKNIVKPEVSEAEYKEFLKSVGPYLEEIEKAPDVGGCSE